MVTFEVILNSTWVSPMLFFYESCINNLQEYYVITFMITEVNEVSAEVMSYPQES